MFFGQFRSRSSLHKWLPDAPPGLARLILKKIITNYFARSSSPLGGNYTPPLAARLPSKILGTSKDIIQRKKEQERNDLGSQVWFSRHQATGGLFHWTLIVHGLVENSFTKYELCKLRGSDSLMFCRFGSFVTCELKTLTVSLASHFIDIYIRPPFDFTA